MSHERLKLDAYLKRVCDWYDNDNDDDDDKRDDSYIREFKKFCPDRDHESESLYDFNGTDNAVSLLKRSIFHDFRLGSSDTEPNYKMSDEDDSSDRSNMGRRCLEFQQFRLIQRYMSMPDFISDRTLRTADNDSNIYAIFSVMLSWSRSKLARFSKFTTIAGIDRLTEELLDIDKLGLLHTYRKHPVCLSTFRLLNRYRNYLSISGNNNNGDDDDDDDDGIEEKNVKNMNDVVVSFETFNIDRYVSNDLKLHFQRVYEKLQTESWTDVDLIDLQDVNKRYGVPFDRFVDDQRVEERPKYITGVACTGKTTILRELGAKGWTIRSRGQLGTFGGKSRSPAYVAALHAALDYSYRKCSRFMIGDRGPIDNPLWTVIMQLCDPKYKNTMVRELLTFFGRTFNELVIRYHAEFQTVVFLDTLPSKNRQRMLNRGESGDVLRGRITHYVEAQFMAYYMFAVLFGHKIVLLPYDNDGNIDSQRQMENARALCEYFGRPETIEVVSRRLMNVGKLDDCIPNILEDYDYSKSLGIFK